MLVEAARCVLPGKLYVDAAPVFALDLGSFHFEGERVSGNPSHSCRRFWGTLGRCNLHYALFQYSVFMRVGGKRPSGHRRPSASSVCQSPRSARAVSEGAVLLYLQWVRRFLIYCRKHGPEEIPQLTLAGATRFTNAYVGQRTHGPVAINSGLVAHKALHAWAVALTALACISHRPSVHCGNGR